MSKVGDGVAWMGTDVMLSMFVVLPHGRRMSMPRAADTTPPPFVHPAYPLEDELGLLDGHDVVEFDFVFDTLPNDFAGFLERRLMEAVAAGAVVAWFAFEGTFRFDYLLVDQLAPHIYAVADRNGVELAIEDDVLISERWRDRIRAARACLYGHEDGPEEHAT